MTENQIPSSNQEEKPEPVYYRIERSAGIMIIGVILLFSTAVIVTLIAPRYVDSTWTSPTSPYQVQMYEIEDPYFYISSVATGGNELQYVRHLKKDFTLLAFQESENLRFVASEELKPYVTSYGDSHLKLTSRLLLLREPQGEAKKEADELRSRLQEVKEEEQTPSNQKKKKLIYAVLELYDPHLEEAFSLELSPGILQDWVDENFTILEGPKHPYHSDYGVVYVQNPQEFRVRKIEVSGKERWQYDPAGEAVKDLAELTSAQMGFYSRKDLIALGEQIYAIEGCWYCHTDQTRTLVEDVVLNGSDSYPAPPSSANEYIYQKITFPGTRRIGPDISRVGIKRPSRDWNKSHFWDATSASPGSIMPSFKHFFDNDPRGTGPNKMGIPNYRFEAMYQYLMTKGTRITPPTQAWWLGKDPIKTKEIIEGQRKLP